VHIISAIKARAYTIQASGLSQVDRTSLITVGRKMVVLARARFVRICSSVVALLLGCISLSCVNTRDGAQRVQSRRPILLSAQYKPGLGVEHPWKVTITQQGSVDYQVFDDSKWTKHALPRLTEKEISRILDVLKKEEFFELNERYEIPYTDLPTMILSVELLGQMNHTVEVYGGKMCLLMGAKDDEERDNHVDVQKFINAWDNVLIIVGIAPK
jgi:hypothetical protein